MVDSLKSITISCGQLSVICDRVLNKLHDPELLHEAYFNGQWESELFDLLPATFNSIHASIDTIQTIRVKSVNINNGDGGTGVTVYEINTRLVETAWMTIAKVQINEKNHTAKGNSQFNKVETLQTTCKSKTRMKVPISPTVAINYSDIAGKDITKIDWNKVSDSKKDWCLDQCFKNAEVYAGMLDGKKCNKRYIECRVYPLRLKDQTFPPLVNDDIDFLLNKSKNVKNGFHGVVAGLQNLLEHHSFLQMRSRLSIDMNHNHYLSIAPQKCMFDHIKIPTNVSAHVMKINPIGK